MTVKFQDYYKTLGVKRTASADEIQTAYRKLARKHHPDVNKGDKKAEEKFKAINEAYEVLKDKDKRQRYDMLGENYQAGQSFRPPPGFEGFSFNVGGGDFFKSAGGGSGFSDFFDTLFGTGSIPGMSGQAGGGFRQRGQNVETELAVTLEDVYHGATKRLTLQFQEDNGRGKITQKTRRFDVKIPKGITNGGKIRLKGQGGPGRLGGGKGDLLIRVDFAPHKHFQVTGSDLTIEVPVAPWEAALGSKIRVPTLDSVVEMKLPQGTQAGQRIRLRGKGLPKKGSSPGHLYVKVQIQIPKNPTAKEKDLLEEWASVSKFNPRKW